MAPQKDGVSCHFQKPTPATASTTTITTPQVMSRLREVGFFGLSFFWDARSLRAEAFGFFFGDAMT